MLCPGSDVTYASNITTAISEDASVQIEERVTDSNFSFMVTLTGTVGGEPVNYGTLNVNNDNDAGWCVLIFSAL